MGITYYLMMPFTLLLTVFYQFFNNYGLALILFALVVKVILFPLSLKGKKGMIQMNMLNGKLQKLQKQYGKDQQRYQLEVQKLYEKEHVNPMGGCLWSFLPLLILLPLYAIIRQPLKYMMGLTGDQIIAVAKAMDWDTVAVSMGWIKPEMITKAMEAAKKAGETYVTCFSNAGYDQLYLASIITPDKLSAVQAAVGTTAKEIFSINFSFLGVNLALKPELKFWVDGLMGFGLFLIPVISALTSVLFSLVTTRTNSMNNQNAQAASTNRMMMLMTPLMSLWIGFAMPAALSVYWVANNVLGMFQEILSGRLLKKDYERAAEAARLREIEEKEEEKRQRREKAEQRAREAEEARKNKGKKKEKDPDQEKLTPEQRAASRVGMRQYARGRAYDPDRFGGVTPYHEDLAKGTIPTETPPEEEERSDPAKALEEEWKEVNDQLEEAIDGRPEDESDQD